MYSVRYDMFGAHQVRIESVPNSKQQRAVDVGDSPLPEGFKISPKNEEFLSVLWHLTNNLLRQVPQRKVPPTKTEVESVMGAKALKNLEKEGLVTVQILRMQDRTGKNPGSRSCVLFTHNARVFCRNKYEKVQSPVEQPGSDSPGLQSTDA